MTLVVPMPEMPIRPRVRWAMLLAVVAIAFAAAWSNRPPPARGADAPAAEFSAERALGVLRRVLPDAEPHPTGSAANARVRDRVLAELAALGLAGEVRRRFVCGESACATVENVLARVPGTSAENAVLLSAHYDSVGAGPGVSDDGVGVAAVLEVARALMTRTERARDVWLLLDDGEEVDLLGAHAFVQEPEFARIGAVVNLEARGTKGPSLLIETGPESASVVAAVAEELARPLATSFDAALYKTLPNDTDFTIYARHGRRGANFAFARGAARYHTPLDDLAHVDADSLQHHGDNALAMTARFMREPPRAAPGRDQAYFNLLGKLMPHWPLAVDRVLFGLAAVLALIGFVRARKAGVAAVRPALAAVTLLGAMLIVAVAVAWMLHRALIAVRPLPSPWTAQDRAMIAAFILLALAIVLAGARLFATFVRPAEWLFAGLVVFLLVALAALIGLPAAAYLTVLPALVGAGAMVLAPERPWTAATAFAGVVAVLWATYLVYVHSAMGHPALVVVTLIAVVMAIPLLPLLPNRGREARMAAVATLVAFLGAMAWSLFAARYDADTPSPLELASVSGGGAQGCVYARAAPVPPSLREAGFDGTVAPATPWSGVRETAGPCFAAQPAPTVETVANDATERGRRVTLAIRSTRGATEFGLRIPLPASGLRVQDVAVPEPTRRRQRASWRALTVLVQPGETLHLSFELPAGNALPLYVADVTPGLPAEAAAIRAVRDHIAVPIHDGDVTLAWTRFDLPR